jgi:hypothetical protein
MASPPTRSNDNQLLEAFEKVDRLLEELIEQQRRKVLEHGQALVPSLTSEDVMNPDGYAALADSGPFNFDDGMLAGYISGQMAIRARLIAPLREAVSG